MSCRFIAIAAALAICSLPLAGCGGSPITPPPPPRPNPVNALPVIDSISVQGRRPRQPARMADLGETVDVTAAVRDAETNIEQLTYQWSATAGTFSGTGRTVTWTAPTAGATPMVVTVTLKVVELYGHPGEPRNFSQDVSATQTLSLHDSGKEVGDMSRQFLIDFSTTSLQDYTNVVMRNFNRAVCPRPREVDDERDQVESHYKSYVMNAYTVGPAQVSINFANSCPVPDGFLPADACAAVRVLWDSTGPEGRRVTSGVDLLTAVYSTADARWWLCSSRFAHDTIAGHEFYSK